MKINTKRVVSVIITAVMMVVMLPSFAMGESGKKYTETLQPEGWTLVENEGGATLSYTKGGGVDLIEVDGYAFKDLDRDGELDVFEDWRVDYNERSRDLATNGGLSLEFQLGLKMNQIDILDPRETFSISDYQRIVRTLIEKMKTENKVPLLVGGSGLYIDAVIKNYNFNEEKRCDENYNKYTNSELHQILKGLDYEMTSKIHPNNRKRLIRAIELAQQPYFKNSRSLGKDFYYDVLCIFLNDNRNSLYQRINNRVDQMIKHGLVEEVRQIGIENFSITSKVAIGYKEMIEYLKGNIDLDEAIELIKKNSRHYAKRQYTWFKNKVSSTIVPINLDDFNHTIDEVEKIINNFLS